MRGTASRRVAVAGSALVVLAILAGAASAQVLGTPYTLTVGAPALEPPTPIIPDTSSAQVTLPWTVSCTQSVPPASAVLAPTGTLDWNVTAPAGVIVTGTLVEEVPLPDCATASEQPGVSRFQVQVSREAPGESALEVRFEGKLRSSALAGATYESEPSVAPIHVVAAFVGRISAKVPEPIAALDNGTAVFLIHLENHGNSRAMVDFAVHADAASRIVPPTPAILAAPWEPGGNLSHTVAFEVRERDLCQQAPAQTPIQLTATPRSVYDEQAVGDTVTANLIVRDGKEGPGIFASSEEGCPDADAAASKDSPTPLAPLVVAGLGLALLARRRG